MPKNSESLNRSLFELLQSKGFDPTMLDTSGKEIPTPEEAEVFQFNFIKDGEDYGKVTISIDGLHKLCIYFSDEVADSEKEETHGEDESWYKVLNQLKRFAQKYQLSFELKNVDHLKHDMAKREYMKKQERISEGYYPMGKKASYNDAVPNVKIVLQHTRQIEEGEQRYRNIAKIFLENEQGERFLAPTIKPGIARVYGRLIAEGDKPHGDRWNHVTSLVEEYQKMGAFVRATRNGQFNESAQRLVNEGINHYQGLRETLSKMTGHRGYNAYFESWTPSLMEEESEESNLNELFVQETLDPRIESVMPILNKLQKKVAEMKEVGELSEWADSLLEAPGAETLKHNDDTEASNLKAFDLAEDDDLQEPAIDELEEGFGDAIKKVGSAVKKAGSAVLNKLGHDDDTELLKKIQKDAGIPAQHGKPSMAKPNDDSDIIEGQGQQLSVQQLATISDEALDNAYKYGRSSPGNTFGWQANLKSAQFAKQMIDKGVTDIEAISDAIHKGWNVTAKAFVQNPDQFDDTEKLKAAGKLDAKLQQRAQLMKQNYSQLPEEEKEKDRVVARALLQAIKGQSQQAVAEDWSAPPQDTTGHGEFVRKHSDGNQNVYRLSQLLNDPSVESYISIGVENVAKPSNEILQGIKSKKWQGENHGADYSMKDPGGWDLKASNPMYFKEFLKALSQSVPGDRQIRVAIDPYVKSARAKNTDLAEDEFAGDYATGEPGQWRNKGPKEHKPATIGDLVGEGQEDLEAIKRLLGEGWKGEFAGGTLGGVSGTVAGSALGALAGGPVGAAIGGVVGGAAGGTAGQMAGRELTKEEQLNEVAPLLAAGARAIMPLLAKVGPKLGQMASGAGKAGAEVAGKTATGIGRGTVDVAKSAAGSAAQNAGQIGVGVGAYQAITDVADKMVGGVGEVYRDVGKAAGAIAQSVGDAIDGKTIAELASAAVKYSIPIGIILAVLYGGKKLIDQVMSEGADDSEMGALGQMVGKITPNPSDFVQGFKKTFEGQEDLDVIKRLISK